MSIIADLHTHTKGSENLFDTLQMMTKVARERGLSFIACTDHAPITSNMYTSWDYNEWRDVPSEMNGVRILRGVEADILDYQGSLSLEIELLKRLDLVIAALHTYCIQPISAKEHTKAYEAILCNPYVDILAHPGELSFPFDDEYILKLAAAEGKAIEINALSQKNNAKCMEQQQRLIELAKHHRTYLAVVSDAQCPASIGEFKEIPDMLLRSQFPEELIINSSESNMSSFLKNRRITKKS